MTDQENGSGDQILRVEKNRNYKTLNLHAIADDADLSWKAVGILSYLLSRPDPWEFHLQDLINRHTDGRSAVRSGLAELEGAGYLEREEVRSDSGHFRYRWTVYERPDVDRYGKPEAVDDRNGLSEAENPSTENPTPSSKESSKKEVSKQNSRRGDDASPLRQLADTDPDENGRLTRALTAAWVSLQPERPSESEIRKQGAVAKRLAKDHTPRRLALALYGMDRLFPHCDGEPWDLFDFERKFSKAANKGAEAARDGPTKADQKENRKYRETLDAIGGGR